MRLALFEPDIPQNTGTLMRLCACLSVPMDVIEPCGFVLSDKNLRRAGMDYVDHLDLTKHMHWDAFKDTHAKSRIVLLSTKASSSFLDFSFKKNDILLLGRESAGVPEYVHQFCQHKVKIPISPQTRSLNVALAAALVLGEALRQTKGYPP